MQNTAQKGQGGMLGRLREVLGVYRDRRMLFIFVNGIASGFPWVVGSVMTLWLKDLGFTRTAIGFVGSVFAVYSLNWIWAPLLDRVRLPWIARMGQRRSWLLVLQGLLLVAIGVLAMVRVEDGLLVMGLMALCVTSVSATQDVVIDAYRIEVVGKEEREKLAAGAGMATCGWWVGYATVGAGALYLADFGLSWNGVYGVLAVFVLFLMGNTLCLPEPKRMREEGQRVQREAERGYRKVLGTGVVGRVGAWCLTTVVEPLRDFFARFGYVAVLVLLFILLFKVGEAFLGRMSLVFYKEVGFSNSEIATYSKLVGSMLTVVFTLLASAVAVHYGLLRGLLIGGIAMAASNLMFAYLAYVGPDTRVFAAAILVDNFTGAFSTVAFVAFISHLVNRAYTATQYALMASLGNFGRTVFAGGSGLLVDSLGGDWVVFFVLTALMVTPSLLMLVWIGRRLRDLFE